MKNLKRDYNIYQIEDNKKILIINNKDEEKKNGVIIWFKIDETNINDLINKNKYNKLTLWIYKS